MLCGQSGNPIVDLGPHFVDATGPSSLGGNFDARSTRDGTYLHNRGIGPIVSSQKMSHELDRFLGRRETDARQALASQMIETFQRKRQMGNADLGSTGSGNARGLLICMIAWCAVKSDGLHESHVSGASRHFRN